MSTIRPNRSVTLLLLAGVFLAATACSARHNGDYLSRVTTRLETPHQEWARPYAMGKPKVLFIVPRTLAPREIVELWQRFDLDFEAFTLAHSGLMSFESDAGAAPYDLAVEGTSIAEKTAELVGKLRQRYDAYVFANASFDILPKEAQYKILKQVSEGAGLVFTFNRSSRLPLFNKPLDEQRTLATAGVPFSGLDYYAREDVLKALPGKAGSDLPGRVLETFRFQKGRIAVLRYGLGSGTYYGGMGLTPPERYSLNWPVNYDYALSLVYRTLLWTIPGKQPRVTLAGLPADGSVIAREKLPQAFTLNLECRKPGGLSGTLRLIVRDKTGREESRRDVPVKVAPSATCAVACALPRVRAGGHFLDVTVRSADGVEEWGSSFFTVTAPVSLAEFGPRSEFCEAGTPAVLTAKLSAPAPAQARLQVSLTDTAGRLYARRNVVLAAGKSEFTVPDCSLTGATTIATRVHVDLFVGPDLLDAADTFVFVPRRQSTEFRSVLWGMGGDTGLAWLAQQQTRAAGFNAILAHPSADGSQERLLALTDYPLVCYAYRVMGSADDKGWRKDGWVKDVADGCVYNPELRQKAVDNILGRIKPVIPYGPTLYSLGDENFFDYKSGFSPTGLAAFRKFVQSQYASLADLNRVWGTSYSDWSQVELLPRDEALKRNLWPMIHDHMAFNESEYADYHHLLAAAIKQADPHAWVGAEGSVPGDLEKTINGLEIWGPYADKRGNELLRSLAPTELVRGNWWGGYVGSHGARAGSAILWNQLLGGAVNISLFFATIGSEGLMSCDLSYADYFQKMLPELDEIYGGAGQLVAASRVATDGIAIHWSQASEHAATLSTSLGTPAASQGNLLGLLDRSGLGYRFVTTSQIEGGALDPSKVRVLFLPCSQALSEQEATAIKRFADGGGLVLADVATGLMDGHCRPLWKKEGAWSGQLDSLFGLTRNGEPRPTNAAATCGVTWKSSRLALQDLPVRLDASVVATTAAMARFGDVPALLMQAVGKGQVGLLNFTFPSPEDPQTAPFLQGLLAAYGVKPASWLTDSKGYSVRRFNRGALALIGVVRQAETVGDTELRLARAGYVYDVRRGKLLGKTDHVAISRQDPAARLYAVLDQRAGAVSLAPPKAAVRGQAMALPVRLVGTQDQVAGRLIRLQVFRPDGSEARPYRAYLTLRGPQAQATVPWALNDPAGAWTLRVTDVATGLTASAKVAVK